MTAIGRLLLTLPLLGLTLALLAETAILSAPARLAPLWALVPALALLLVQLGIDLRLLYQEHADGEAAGAAGHERGAAPDGPPQGLLAPIAGPGRMRRELVMFAWLAGLTLGVLMLGIQIAVPAFLALSLRFLAREPWWRAIAAGLVVLALVTVGLRDGLGIVLPEGWLLRRLG